MLRLPNALIVKGSPSGVRPLASSVTRRESFRFPAWFDTAVSRQFQGEHDAPAGIQLDEGHGVAGAATDLLGVDARRATVSSRYADHARFDRPSVGEHQPDRAHRGRHRGLDRLDARFAEQRGVPVAGRGEADGVVGAAHDQHFGSARPGVCHRRRPMTGAQSAEHAAGLGAHLEAGAGGGAPVAQSDLFGFFGPGCGNPTIRSKLENRPHGGNGAGKEFVFDRVGLADQRSIRCVLVRLQQRTQGTFFSRPEFLRAACEASNSRLAADRAR